MTKTLYGPNGSEYERVKHIPQPEDGQGIVYYKYDGHFYRNQGGSTWVMTKKGQPSWANKIGNKK